ncbi:MAG: hypothetical protein AAF614_39495 [Chloroflexota bacterium]
MLRKVIRKGWWSLLVLSVFLVGSQTIIYAAPGDIELVSIPTRFTEGIGGHSLVGDMSTTGRFAAFDSSATNLVSNDNNNFSDVFVYDHETGGVKRRSLGLSGNEPNHNSLGPSLSSDGRFVAFESYASNLVVNDTNGVSDIFVHDNLFGSTTRVSVDNAGVQGDSYSFGAAISGDGRYVVFGSEATNLVPNDTNSRRDIFVHDRDTGTTKRVSVDSSGTEANNTSFGSEISEDGRYIVFRSSASNLVSGDNNGKEDIFVYDQDTSTTTRVSVDSSGNEGDGDSNIPSLSSDGRYVAFSSESTNLVSRDNNGVSDVFLHDRNTGTTTRVSLHSSGQEGNGTSWLPEINADGDTIVFSSEANNLVNGDNNGKDDVFRHFIPTGETTRFSIATGVGWGGNQDSLVSSVSGNGYYAIFHSEADNLVGGDTNTDFDVFLHHFEFGTTIRISVADHDYQGNDHSNSQSISGNGRFIAFKSAASNLVDGDTNDRDDIFVRDETKGITERVSVANDEAEANSNSNDPVISEQGRYIAFVSDATNLVTNDTNNSSDVFVRDRVNNSTKRISVVSGGFESNGASYSPSISDDGRYIAFVSEATNLVANDTNGLTDVFVHDMVFGTTNLVSVDSSGNQGNGVSGDPSISGNGRYVVFESLANNLIAGDTNGYRDVFFHDRYAATTVPVSINGSNVLGNDQSTNPVVDDSGRHVAFRSAADNLVASDTNNDDDVFVHDMQQGLVVRVSVASDGSEANEDIIGLAMSGDGIMLAFWSESYTLAPGATPNMNEVFYHDRSLGTTTLLSVDTNEIPSNGASYVGGASMSNDGKRIAFRSEGDNLAPYDTNGRHDIFVRDMDALNTVRVSVRSNAETQGNDSSGDPSVSDNGRYVAFVSSANNMVTGDFNDELDVFVRDRDLMYTRRVSVASDGTEANNDSSSPVISGDGSLVLFQSQASNLVSNDTNSNTDIFIHALAAATTTRLSLSTAGAEGNGSSHNPAMSSDGRFVAFESRASNLVSGDSNNSDDIFVHDRDTGVTTRVSVATGGAEGNDDSGQPSISNDGRYVAFASRASNLVSGDTNNDTDIFVHDRQTGTTIRVSVSSSGTESNFDSEWPSISGDGSVVAFTSQASNLVSGSAGGHPDVFVHNLQAGTTVLASIASDGTYGSGESENVSISDDGRFVTYHSDASNLVSDDTNGRGDIFVHDLLTGDTIRVSLTVDGNEVNLGSSEADINNDGSLVVFSSGSDDFTTDDWNGWRDAFIKELEVVTVYTPNVGALDIMSVDNNGVQTNFHSYNPSVSDDGRFVVFETNATNLVSNDTNGVADDLYVRDRVAGTIEIILNNNGTQANNYSVEPSISGDGRYVAFHSQATDWVSNDTNGKRDVFVHDRDTDTTTRVSVSSSGGQGNGASIYPAISANGRYVAFYSTSTNLVGGDSNGQADVFVHDRQTGTTTRVSVSSSGAQTSGLSSIYPDISDDGRYVAFTSNSTNLVSGDTNGVSDTFIHDTQTGTTTRVSVDSSGTQANGLSEEVTISGNGRYVAYASQASNLVTNDNNGKTDIFVHDTQTGTTTRVSVASDGTEGNDHSEKPSLNGDGRFVSFNSHSSNFASNDTNGTADDIFVHDMQTGNTAPISVTATGIMGNGTSWDAEISGDGRVVAFESRATNLVSGDINNWDDIFAKEWTATVAIFPSMMLNSNGLFNTNNNNPSCDYNLYQSELSYDTFNFVTGDLPNYDASGALDSVADNHFYLLEVDCHNGDTATTSLVGEFSFAVESAGGPP